MTDAISFPRSFPDWFKGMNQSAFRLNYLQEQDPKGDADVLTRDVGPTLWKAEYRTGILSQDRMAELEAWLDSLENGGNTFWAYDFRRPYPLVYPNGFSGLNRAGGGAFDGTCNLDTVDDDNKRVTISDLPAGFVFSPFDHLAFTYGSTSHALHRIMAAETADEDGAVIVEVRPHVRVGWEADLTINLVKPACLMKLVPDSYSPDTKNRGRGTISFKASQTVKEDT